MGPVELLVHEDIAAPLTCGFSRPCILLPSEAQQWNDSDLRRALVHELEHVRRRDWVIQLAARAACALYWFHPLAWVAWRRLCLEAERACDDAVLQRQASGPTMPSSSFSSRGGCPRRRAACARNGEPE